MGMIKASAANKGRSCSNATIILFPLVIGHKASVIGQSRTFRRRFISDRLKNRRWRQNWKVRHRRAYRRGPRSVTQDRPR